MTLEEPKERTFDANLVLFHLKDEIGVQEEPLKESKISSSVMK